MEWRQNYYCTARGKTLRRKVFDQSKHTEEIPKPGKEEIIIVHKKTIRCFAVITEGYTVSLLEKASKIYIRIIFIRLQRY